MQHFKPTCAIPLGEVTAFIPEGKLYHRTKRGPRLSPSVMADLTVIAAANDQGFPSIARIVLTGLEARLGVTEHDKVAALAGDEAMAGAFIPLEGVGGRLHRLRESLSERAARPKRRALLIEVNRDAQVKQAALLRTVDLREAEVRSARGASAKRRARAALDRALAAMQDQADATWCEDAVHEATGLATARGDAIAEIDTTVSDWLRDPLTGAVIRDRKTRMPVLRTEHARAHRVESRTGLLKAFEDGMLDGGERNISGERLYEVGKRYRDAYEFAEGRATAPKDPGSPQAQRCSPSPGPQAAILVAAEALAQMRGSRMRGHAGAGWRMTRFQRAVVDAVCGQDHVLSAVADQFGRSRGDTKKALRTGLEVAGDNLGWW